jgi:holliday junction DNA helicase RuvB
MEDYRIDIMIDSGPNARSIQITLNPFTLIGATTRMGLLTAPMRARFGITCHLDYYDAPPCSSIIQRSAGIPRRADHRRRRSEIARRSRGTPRIANALLRRIRDFAQIKGNGAIDAEIAKFGLAALNVDEGGLDEMDNRILTPSYTSLKAGPWASPPSPPPWAKKPGTIEEVHEPFLIMEGYIQRTPRGPRSHRKGIPAPGQGSAAVEGHAV